MADNGIYPPTVLWLTGLSGAGKTSIAQCLMAQFEVMGITPVLLDGDEIRKTMPLIGFDQEARKTHNRNVGKMAAMAEKQGKVVIVALISPYEDVRQEIRAMCHNFIEVYVSTNLDTCIKRDPKGLYKRALSGEIKDFTGINAPYQKPQNPEIQINTENKTIDECSQTIFQFYKNKYKNGNK